jgi:hypothetical protein
MMFDEMTATVENPLRNGGKSVAAGTSFSA